MALVEQLLLGEFDIDKGSIISFQYPTKLQVDEDVLAELMIPSGCHKRDCEVNYFILRSPPPQTEDSDAAATLEDWLILESTGTAGPASDYTLSSKEKKPSGAVANAPSHRMTLQTLQTPTEPPKYGISVVFNRKDQSVRRGAVIKALAVISAYPLFDTFVSPLLKTLEAYFRSPSDTTILCRLFHTLNDAATSDSAISRVLSGYALQRRYPLLPQLYSGLRPPDHVVSIGEYKLRLPCIPSQHALSAVSVSHLVRHFGEGVLTLYHAVLLEKRVLFIGYEQPSQVIASFVLAAALLVSPLVAADERVFPSVSLADQTFQRCRGYIAGTTNPSFESQCDAWDVLCMIDTARVVARGSADDDAPATRLGSLAQSLLSTTASGAGKAAGWVRDVMPFGGKRKAQAAADAKFLKPILRAVALGSKANVRGDEAWVRAQFRDHTVALLDLALGLDAASLGGADAADTIGTAVGVVEPAVDADAYSDVVAALRQTAGFRRYAQTLFSVARFSESINVGTSARVLRVLAAAMANPPAVNMAVGVLKDFVTFLRTDDHIVELVHYLAVYQLDLSVFLPHIADAELHCKVLDLLGDLSRFHQRLLGLAVV